MTATRIGGIDGVGSASVDSRGRVSPAPGRPSVDWWVGADDRWHVPAREATVRQRLVDGQPVVETRLRVPGGEAVHRAFVARLPSAAGGGEAVVVEVENATSLPFALALAVRPDDASGEVPVGRLALDGPVLSADGDPLLVLQRPPGRAIAAAGRDVLDEVIAGEATGTGFAPVDDPGGRAHAAVIVPVPHTTTFRAVLPLDGPAGASGPSPVSFPTALPRAADVAAGWAAHTRSAARVVLPDDRRSEAFRAAPGALLLASTTPAAGPDETADRAVLAEALAALGLEEPSGRVLAGALLAVREQLVGGSDVRGAAAVVAAVGRSLLRQPDEALAEAAAEVAARVAQSAADRARPRRRLLGRGAGASVDAPTVERVLAVDDAELLRLAAAVLDAADEPRGATDARAAAVASAAARTSGPVPAGGLDELLDAATGTWTWPGRSWAQTARATLLAGAELVLAGPDGLDLVPGHRDDWLGQGVELHGWHTTLGVVSFAVRWHADRPALLWEVEPAPHLAGPPRLSAPALDPAWSTTEARGEALLAPVPVPAGAGSEPPRQGVVIGGLQIGRRGDRGDGVVGGAVG